MYLLDTDPVSPLELGGTEDRRIRTRLRSVGADDVATTIISYEEQMRGWLARLAQAKKPERQVIAYMHLSRQLRNYCSIPVVEFDDRSAAEFERLRKARIRIGTMDLKIAAIALANGATVVTRNSTDFGKVPGLMYEDWSLQTEDPGAITPAGFIEEFLDAVVLERPDAGPAERIDDLCPCGSGRRFQALLPQLRTLRRRRRRRLLSTTGRSGGSIPPRCAG